METHHACVELPTAARLAQRDSPRGDVNSAPLVTVRGGVSGQLEAWQIHVLRPRELHNDGLCPLNDLKIHHQRKLESHWKRIRASDLF